MTTKNKKKYCVANSLFQKSSNYQDSILFYCQKQLPHLDTSFNFAIIVSLVSYGFE
jgi:hypothetical protein